MHNLRVEVIIVSRLMHPLFQCLNTCHILILHPVIDGHAPATLSSVAHINFELQQPALILSTSDSEQCSFFATYRVVALHTIFNDAMVSAQDILRSPRRSLARSLWAYTVAQIPITACSYTDDDFVIDEVFVSLH